jgi:hypothetical protein
MSFQSTVGVEFGQRLGMTSLTNRAQGAQVTTRVQLGDFGSNRAIVTLRNDDGALTPGAGGTYSSVDWYSQALQLIGNTGTYDFKVFYGIITSFSLQDDGVNSTVVLEADDFFTTGGRAGVVSRLGSAIRKNQRGRLHRGLVQRRDHLRVPA